MAAIAKVGTERDVGNLAHGAERRKRRPQCQFTRVMPPRSVRRVRRDARDAPSEIAEVRGHFAELVRGTLELAQRVCLIRR